MTVHVVYEGGRHGIKGVYRQLQTHNGKHDYLDGSAPVNDL